MVSRADRWSGYRWILWPDLRGPAIRTGGAGGCGAPNQCSYGRSLGMLETERTFRKTEDCSRLPDHSGSWVDRLGLTSPLIKKI